MYVIIVSFRNGDVEYYGPFPTEDRALLYGQSIDRDIKPARWFVKPMTVPFHTVVKRVEWANAS